MNRTNRHFSLSVILTALTAISILSSCQNQNNGPYGSNNWNRNAYANKVLSAPINSAYYALNGGQVVGYITRHSNVAYNPSSQAGGINRGAGTSVTGPGGIAGSQTAPGGIAGGAPQAAQNGAGCEFKILSVSPVNGSTQSFGSTLMSSGRGVYPAGMSFPIICGDDSEVAATANSFYVTGGSASGQVFVFRMTTNGAFIGINPIPANGPTRISASASGHIAFIENGGQTLRLFSEIFPDGTPSIGGDRSFIAHEVPNPPVMNNQIIKDIVIDGSPRQGSVYVASELPGHSGRSIKIYDIHALYEGNFYQPFYDSQSAFMNQGNHISYSGWAAGSNNLDQSVVADIVNNGAVPVSIKNFDGLTVVQTATGKPFVLEAQLTKAATETSSAAPQEQSDAANYYQNQIDDGYVSAIYAYDPYQVNYNVNSYYTQNAFKFADVAIGNNYLYGVSQGTLYTCHISKDDQYSCARPRQIGMNYLGTLKKIEMSYDTRYALIMGTAGMSIANIYNGSITISPTGRPDVVGEVIHAASLAKITDPPAIPNTNNQITTSSSLIQR